MNYLHKLQDSSEIKVTYDPSGVLISTSDNCESDQKNEPAWNYRLWSSSIHLAMFLEDEIRNGRKPDCVLELGAGTGLPSMVAHKLNIPYVISTEMSRAIPLLYYNFKTNLDKDLDFDENIIEAKNTPDVGEQVSGNCLKCPANHDLVSFQVDSDEYMCSVCDDDLIENDKAFRCEKCNYDVCDACLNNDNSDSIPVWLKVSNLFQSHFPNYEIESNVPFQYEQLYLNSKLCLTSFDWSKSDDCTRVTNMLKSEDNKTITILGADITYDKNSVIRVINCLKNLVEHLKTTGNIRVLLMHQVRSNKTIKSLIDGLSMWNYSSKLIEVSQDFEKNDIEKNDIEKFEDENNFEEGEEEKEEIRDKSDTIIKKNGVYLFEILC